MTMYCLSEKCEICKKTYNKNASHSIMAGKKSFIIYLIIYLFEYFPLTHKKTEKKFTF